MENASGILKRFSIDFMWVKGFRQSLNAGNECPDLICFKLQMFERVFEFV